MDDKGLGHEHMAPVLSRRDNNLIGGKGMKIARAAKRLAMLITVVALAVVTMACQGAVGPQGDQGPKGDKGDTGNSGATGPAGPAGVPGDTPFANLPGDGAITAMTSISTNPLKDDGFPVAPPSVDVSQYFYGGIGELTYRLVGQKDWGTTPAEHGVEYDNYTVPGTYATAPKYFTAKLAEDGKTLEFSVQTAVREVAVPEAAEEYTQHRSVIVLEAKDSQDKVAVHLLVVGNNRAPRDQASLPTNFRIGVQPDSVRGDDGELITALEALDESGGVWENFRCTNYNTCELQLAGYFDDDEGDSALVFDGKAQKPSEMKHVAITPIKGGIKIVGLVGTFDDPATAGVTEPSSIVVSVTATDPGGLESSRPLTVAIEARPTFKSGLPDFTIKKGDIPEDNSVDNYLVGGNLRITDADDAFSALTISSKSSNTDIVADGAVTQSTNALVLALIGDAGAATVTVRATEPLNGTDGIGQWAEDSFAVTVTN